MEDHFVLHVDNLLRESTVVEAADERRKLSVENPTKKYINGAIDNKFVDCRICHDEDEVLNMETPCSCCGTMKYAHRKCIQQWCDEKGDITCEICQRPFLPGYNAPIKSYVHGRIAMNLITLSEYDEYAISRRRSIVYCRSIAIICLLLLLLRESLTTIINGSEQYSLQTFMVQLLKTAGIVLPLYIMLRVVTTFQCCQQLQHQETSEI